MKTFLRDDQIEDTLKAYGMPRASLLGIHYDRPLAKVTVNVRHDGHVKRLVVPKKILDAEPYPEDPTPRRRLFRRR